MGIMKSKVHYNNIVCSPGCSLRPAQAQSPDLKRQYKHARQLFDNKDYALAMEAFKPLIVYDKRQSKSMTTVRFIKWCVGV